MKYYKFIILVLIFGFFSAFFIPACRAMPPGTLLYRTSEEGKMFGYSGDSLTDIEKGILKAVSSGHVGIYIGKENGIDYVVEALADGIVKMPAERFVNESAGEKYLGAKIPRELDAVRQAKVVAIAKSLVDNKLAYDFDFKAQKGPKSGQWTCVGLTEKIYESADISNPRNLQALEYNHNYYALDITPDGLDNYSVDRSSGDVFSQDYEFSKINRRTNILIPAPELIGFNLGYEKDGERYIFLPYTQFLQDSLADIKTDIQVNSSFAEATVRGSVNSLSLALRWSLINNPLSSLKTAVHKIGDLASDIKKKLFNSSEEEMNMFLTDVLEDVNPPAAELAKVSAVINKADKNLITDNSNSFLAPTEDNLSKIKKGSTASDYYSPDDEPIMTQITKALKEGLAPAASGDSGGVSASWTNKDTSTEPDLSSLVDSNKNSEERANNHGGSNSDNSDNSNNKDGNNKTNDVAVEQKINVNIPKIATINKIYSTGENDFIELYNPTDLDFDLATEKYRLEKAKTAEDPGLMIRIGDPSDAAYPGGTIIKAHDTYLIVKSTASNYYLSQADAIANRSEFSWPGNAYTIYLGTGAISSSQDPDILEAVGFGDKATYYQGSAPALEIKDNYVLRRVKNTNNNNLDFTLAKSSDPSIDWSVELSANNTNNSNNTNVNAANTNNANNNTNNNTNNTSAATSTSVTVNTATSTATSTSAIVNTATSTNNVSTTTENISTSTVIIATSTDDVATSAPEIALALINKIYSTGNTDWLELYNPTGVDFDLATAGYRIEKAKTTEDPNLIMRIGSSSDGYYPGGTIIKSGETYLIASSDSNDYFKNKANAIATRTDFSWFNSGYTLYLGNDPISSSTDKNIVDYVGFGADAKYWQGVAPALALKDNYILTRVANSLNNNLDFNLIKSDDPGIEWGEDRVIETSSNVAYTFSENSYDLFPQPEPITSPGIVNLWHFDECSGAAAFSSYGSTTLAATGNWLPGKFGCAKHNGYSQGKVSAYLAEPVNINNFSLSFWYKQTTDYPRLNITLANQNEGYINLIIEKNLVIVDGLAADVWRNELDLPFDETWRQFTLVINRQEGYWSIYIDGVEKYHIDTYRLLPEIDFIDIGGNNWDYGLDELVLWNRALESEEIVYNIGLNEPFAPLIIPKPQEKAELKHFWSFNEAIGTSSRDLIGGVAISLKNSNWVSTDLTNSYLSTQYGEIFEASLPEINSSDLSLTYKWRVPDLTNSNRVRVSLDSSPGNHILALISEIYTPTYYLNNQSGYFYFTDPSPLSITTAWHDIALVYDSYRYKLSYYIDGELMTVVNYVWPDNKPPVNRFEIFPENFAAEIDDVGIWAGALSPQQVAEISANN